MSVHQKVIARGRKRIKKTEFEETERGSRSRENGEEAERKKHPTTPTKKDGRR